MRDIERQLTDLGARVEERAASRRAFPAGLERRVRRRQAATAATTLLAIAALVGASVVGLRWAVERVSTRPGGGEPVPGPTESSTPRPLAFRVVDGTEVGPAEIDPRPEDQWAPARQPIFLGGERVFEAEWRLYAWRAESGFVGWYDIDHPSGEHLVAGGNLVEHMPPCRLMQQIADLEEMATPNVRKWLVYGYVSNDVETVEIMSAGKTFELPILRLPDGLGAPFDMFAVAIDRFPAESQGDLALSTRIRDADGNYLDPGDPELCLGAHRE